MAIRALALTSGETGLEDHRLLIGALLGATDGQWPLDRRGGIFYSPGAADLTGDGMTARIGPFAAVVPGGSSPLQGAYLVVNTETVEVVLGDGDGTGTRTDVIGVVVNDDLYDESGATAAAVRVVDQAVDTSFIPLYAVDVPQGASAGTGGIPWGSAVQDMRPYTAASGGVVTVPDLSARGRLEAVGEGTLVHVVDRGDLYQFRRQNEGGTDWVPAVGPDAVSRLESRFDERYEPIGRPKMLTGRVYITPVDEENGRIYADYYLRGTERVTFPSGYFTSTPIVFLTARSSVPGVAMEVSYTDAGADGFTACLARYTDTATVVDWMAIEEVQ